MVRRRDELEEEINQIVHCFPQSLVTNSNIGQISTWIVLSPKLFSERLSQWCKDRKAAVVSAGYINEAIEIVNALQFPAVANQISFQIAFDAFLKKLHRGIARPANSE